MASVYRTCPRCRFPLTALDRYCGVCGFKSSRMCPRCEHEVPNDLSFCSYCGQPFAPIESEERLPKTERLRLLYVQEVRAFRDKVEELEFRIRHSRRSAVRRRGLELILFCLALMILVIWGLPLLENQINTFYSQSPIRALSIVFLAGVLLILGVGYVLQVRQVQDDAKVDELRDRLIVARERYEEVKQRHPDWSEEEERSWKRDATDKPKPHGPRKEPSPQEEKPRDDETRGSE